MSREDLQRHIRTFDQIDHERILQMRQCYIRLYALNISNFRHWTLSVLRNLAEPLVSDFEKELLKLEGSVAARKVTTVR